MLLLMQPRIQIGLLGCEHILLGHAELLINKHPEVLLLRPALNLFSIQPVFMLGIAISSGILKSAGSKRTFWGRRNTLN